MTVRDMSDKTKIPSAGRRNMSRYCAVQALYQWRLTGQDLASIEDELPFDCNLERADVDYLRNLISHIASHHADLDKQLASLLDRPMERLDPVEVSIFYVGLCELNCRPDVPVAVIIDEAINLARLFGCQDSYKYINAILHKAAAGSSADRPKKQD